MAQRHRPAGVSSDAKVQQWGQSPFIRPLLFFPREAISSFAKQHQLNWIEDESNLLLKFKRNYIRKEVIPLLLSSKQTCLDNLTRTADHCAEAVQLLADLAEIDLKHIPHKKDTLDITGLLKLDQARQRNVLRHWLSKAKVKMPTTAQLLTLQKEVMGAQKTANPLLRLGNTVIRRYHSKLYISSFRKVISELKVQYWDMSTVFALPDRLGTLNTKTVLGEGLSRDFFTNKNVVVTFRQGGERMHPSRRNKSTSLKHLFQEWGIPPWKRASQPLIFFNNQLIAVPNVDVDRRFCARQGERGVQIIWQEMTGEKNY